MTFTAADIAKQQRAGVGSVSIASFAQADKVKAGDLTFAEKETFFGESRREGRVRSFGIA